MQALKNLLSKGQKTTSGPIDEKTVLFVARKVLAHEYGVRGEENITPAFYKKRKLFLTPRSSLWANEVLLHKSRILEQVNGHLGSQEVLEIKIARQ